MKGQMFIQFVILDPYFVFQISWLMVGEALPPLPPLTARHWFFSFRNLNNLRLPEKQSLPWTFSLYWIFFSHSGFLSNLHLTWNKSLPWTFSLYWIYFLHSGFLCNLRLPWKREYAITFATVLNILFTLRIFEQLVLALKKRVCLKLFTVLNIDFTFRIFEQICACPEMQSVTWKFSLYWIYFLHSGVLSN